MDDLYKKYWKSLVNDGYKKIGDFQIAEDCAQETLAFVYKTIEGGKSFETYEELTAFVYRTNANVVLHALRNKYSNKTDVVDIENSMPNLKDTKSETSTDYTALYDALSRLPFHYALAVRLRIENGLSYKEIGEKMNCSGEGARKYVTRGLKELREILEAEKNV